MTGGPCCAHCRVSWRTKEIEGGLTTGWWECDSGCGMRFTTLPHAAAIAAEPDPRDAQIAALRGASILQVIAEMKGAAHHDRTKDGCTRSALYAWAERLERWMLAEADEALSSAPDASDYADLTRKLAIIELEYRAVYQQKPILDDGAPSLAGEMADALATARRVIGSLPTSLLRGPQGAEK